MVLDVTRFVAFPGAARAWTDEATTGPEIHFGVPLVPCSTDRHLQARRRRNPRTRGQLIRT